MPQNYENDPLDYGTHGNNPNDFADATPDYETNDPYYQPGFQGFHWVLANLEMFIIYPVVMVVNMMLFVTILKSKKLRQDPWRWLIAHSSFCISITALTVFINRFTIVYHLPSLYTSTLCPMVLTLFAILRQMVIISLVLVASERFRALYLNRPQEGGMGKQAVILAIVLFWLLVVIVQTIPLAVEPIFGGKERFVYFDMMPGHKACFALQMVIPAITTIVLFLWALLTVVTVIVGTSIMSYRKIITPEMKKSIVVPTLTFAVLFFLFSLTSECAEVLSLLHIIMISEITHALLHFLLLLTWISFPVTWLVTWSRSGDISWSPCCLGESEEKRHLLEPK